LRKERHKAKNGVTNLIAVLIAVFAIVLIALALSGRKSPTTLTCPLSDRECNETCAWYDRKARVAKGEIPCQMAKSGHLHLMVRKDEKGEKQAVEREKA